MASSIVCVAKKDGGVCIACDYRYLNTYTGDAFPMATVNDTLSSDTPRVRAMLLPTGYLEPCEMTPVVMYHVCMITTFWFLTVNTIPYDSGYLTCSKKLTGSQLSLPHGTNKKL